MVCNDGLANTTESFFSHSFQLICNVSVTPLRFVQLCSTCCCSCRYGACPRRSAPAGRGCRSHSTTLGCPGLQPRPPAGSDGAYSPVRVVGKAERWCCSCCILVAVQISDLTVLATFMYRCYRKAA